MPPGMLPSGRNSGQTCVCTSTGWVGALGRVLCPGQSATFLPEEQLMTAPAHGAIRTAQEKEEPVGMVQSKEIHVSSSWLEWFSLKRYMLSLPSPPYPQAPPMICLLSFCFHGCLLR